MAASSGAAHGLFKVQFALTGTDGIAYGIVGSGLAQDAISGALVQNYPKSANLPLPDRTVLDFTGGNRWLGSFQYGITTLGSFGATFDNLDADLIAMVGGSLKDTTTTSAWTIFAENILRATVPQTMVMITMNLQARGAEEGADYYLNIIVGRSWSGPKGLTGGPAFQAMSEYNIQITPTSTNVFPHGVAFGVNQAFENNASPTVYIITAAPLHSATYIGDGVTTTFTLPYLPLDSTVTQSASRTQVAVAGTPTAPTTINISTGVVTMTAAPAADAVVGILYETNFVASP